MCLCKKIQRFYEVQRNRRYEQLKIAHHCSLRLFNGDYRELQGYLKEVQEVFQGSFKTVSKTRKFQGCLKKVSRGFQEIIKKKDQGCFKNVTIQFCFPILFLHGTHRSYLTRGRAC